VVPGDVVFKLYDTYGFPADLTADMARELNLSIDYDLFEAAMTEQRERSRQASQFTMEHVPVSQNEQTPTEFTGHQNLLHEHPKEKSKIIAIYRDGQFCKELNSGEKASIVLDRSPFYAESGGQVGDQGLIHIDRQIFFKVADTIKQGQVHLHLGKLEKGFLKVGDEVQAEVDAKRRAAIVLNHTATHLLHLVLKNILGEQAIQKGSLVEAERLRFDFSHPTPLSQDTLQQIEHQVNHEIRANYEGHVHITSLDQALAEGAIGLFGDKYGSQVRVVNFGPSKELCGGTHAERTGDIGFFKITTETGVASGIRRIEAVTGDYAISFLEKRDLESKQKLLQNEERLHQLEKEIEQLKDKLAGLFSRDLSQHAKQFGHIFVLAKNIEGLDGKGLRNALDHLKQELKSAIIILTTTKDNKVGIVGGITSDLIEHFNAKDIVNMVATQVGGRGGGRADMAEAGGNKPENLEKALQSVYTVVSEKIASLSKHKV